MREYIRTFILRGLVFGGFGPIILGIVYLILSMSLNDFSLSGYEVFLATISVYLLAFIQAGASVFNQIESWSVVKSTFVHLGVLYIAYILCYLVNIWIPFHWIAIAIFTGIFVIAYFVIWFVVYIVVRNVSKKLNMVIEKNH